MRCDIDQSTLQTVTASKSWTCTLRLQRCPSLQWFCAVAAAYVFGVEGEMLLSEGHCVQPKLPHLQCKPRFD